MGGAQVKSLILCWSGWSSDQFDCTKIMLGLFRKSKISPLEWVVNCRCIAILDRSNDEKTSPANNSPRLLHKSKNSKFPCVTHRLPDKFGPIQICRKSYIFSVFVRWKWNTRHIFFYLGDYNIVMKAIIMLYFRRAPANNEKRKIAWNCRQLECIQNYSKLLFSIWLCNWYDGNDHGLTGLSPSFQRLFFRIGFFSRKFNLLNRRYFDMNFTTFMILYLPIIPIEHSHFLSFFLPFKNWKIDFREKKIYNFVENIWNNALRVLDQEKHPLDRLSQFTTHNISITSRLYALSSFAQNT